MDPDRPTRRRLDNLLQTVALLAGMVGLLTALGWLVAGAVGVAVAATMGLALGLLAPRVPPRVILRLYRGRPISPAQAPGLYRLAAELARQADLPVVPDLYYVPSRVMNAFAAGDRTGAAIGVTDGLLRGLTLRELRAVLAHEMSHLMRNDLRVMALADVVSRLTGLFSLVGQALLLFSLPLVLLGRAHVPLLPVLLLIFAPSLSALLQMGLSRAREYDADRSAADLTGDPEGLASALEKMDFARGGWLSRLLLPGRRVPDPSLLRTHPPTEARVRHLLALASRPGTPVVPGPEGPLRDLFGEVRRRPRWRITGVWY